MRHRDPEPIDSPSSGAYADQLRRLETRVAELRRTGQLFEQSPTAAVVINAQGRLLEINKRAAELLESPVSVLTGRQLVSLFPATAQGTLRILLEQVRKTGSRQVGEVQYPGQDILIDITPHPAAGEELQYHLTLTDVTDFKEAHRHLMDVNQVQTDQLQSVQQKLRQSSEEIEQAVRLSKQQLQLRMEKAEQLLQQSPQERTLDDFVQFEEAFVQIRNLLNSLDRYTRTRFMRIRVRQVNLDKVWREVVQDAAEQLRSREVEITAANLPVLQGDTQVLRMILSEFLMNALKFTRSREQVRLHLHVRETAEEYWIGLEDNGVGFNTRYKDKAFQLYGRLHSDEYEGTGLGLAVVQRLCRRLGARTWGEGKIGQGATFWVAWPKQLPDELG